jgi:hypothetical protein
MGEPLNPYESPRSDLDTAVPAGQSTTPIDMPASVKATVSIVVALAFMVGYGAVVQGTVAWGQLGLIGLLLWGIFRRKALAWQYLRMIGVLAFVAGACANVSSLMNSRSLGDPRASVVAVGVSFLMTALCLLPVVLVSTEKARRYFGLLCPACGSAKVKASDFLYREKLCKTCRRAWR